MENIFVNCVVHPPSTILIIFSLFLKTYVRPVLAYRIFSLFSRRSRPTILLKTTRFPLTVPLQCVLINICLLHSRFSRVDSILNSFRFISVRCIKIPTYLWFLYCMLFISIPYYINLLRGKTFQIY